ncbi:hypothetical protein AA101099_1755 [Neoasaia chiangmaiensis NBRC 101099]|uniref:Uncharacterized protein n=1 Tax=Neoasaia chiangmaiensis TaxID=320497 RepID=A0A1U9KRI7_9PROT|nr:hypothetical protein [Neoasaia chiangmaiensis]AQS88290.1 hypothetical protein A0U93_10420 [Neoasaia chiangmaiensis]GBR39637.1 hypothetical protein AA101099_1755 [Neoasaia chiangmaiensis NBRC 101099]GEN14676.1 hypothetical protein NCH01_11070 [Neoasaia chiangmaiensis]
MDPTQIATDAGLPQLVTYILQYAVGVGWLPAKTMAAIVSLYASLVTIATHIGPYLNPPPAQRPAWTVTGSSKLVRFGARVGCALRLAFWWAWLVLYRVVTFLRRDVKATANVRQIGRSAAMVPVDKRGSARSEIADSLGIPRDQTKP